MESFKELWEFLKTSKKFWLLPALLLLVVFGVLIILGSGSAVAPLIYTIF